MRAINASVYISCAFFFFASSLTDASYDVLCSLFYSPIAAAISAHGFVASGLSEMPEKAEDGTDLQSLREDVRIIGSSLYFVDDFLRSMLDIHASTANKLKIHFAPTDLLKDVLEPVQSILYQRDGHVDVKVECAEGLIIETDCLRLKQVSSVDERRTSRPTIFVILI